MSDYGKGNVKSTRASLRAERRALATLDKVIAKIAAGSGEADSLPDGSACPSAGVSPADRAPLLPDGRATLAGMTPAAFAAFGAGVVEAAAVFQRRIRGGRVVVPRLRKNAAVALVRRWGGKWVAPLRSNARGRWVIDGEKAVRFVEAVLPFLTDRADEALDWLGWAASRALDRESRRAWERDNETPDRRRGRYER